MTEGMGRGMDEAMTMDSKARDAGGVDNYATRNPFGSAAPIPAKIRDLWQRPKHVELKFLTQTKPLCKNSHSTHLHYYSLPFP
jgi:hypothetical protein